MLIPRSGTKAVTTKRVRQFITHALYIFFLNNHQSQILDASENRVFQREKFQSLFLATPSFYSGNFFFIKYIA